MQSDSVIADPQLRCRLSIPPAAAKAPFALPVISNLRAVEIALAEVALRIADNTLDSKRAGLLLQCLQTAAATHST